MPYIKPYYQYCKYDKQNKKRQQNIPEILKRHTKTKYRLLGVKVNDWNHDLSPWQAPPVFGNEPFGDGAPAFLEEILALCGDKDKTYVIGGYSLAGLFALWASCQTDAFAGVAAASPSAWFPGLIDHVKAHPPKARALYLSLGEREEISRNPVMATVGDRIRELHDLFSKQNIPCELEWNPGNHFSNPDIRTAKAFAWALEQLKTKKPDAKRSRR